MMTAILLFIFIIGLFLVDLLPEIKLQQKTYEYVITRIIAFFAATYVVYYFFNALDFGFTLTYYQVIFIYALLGKASMGKNKNINN